MAHRKEVKEKMKLEIDRLKKLKEEEVVQMLKQADQAQLTPLLDEKSLSSKVLFLGKKL